MDRGTELDITRRERDVLIALCRPAASSEVFVEPASVHEIAQELVVTDAAVKQHLQHLYDKLGIPDGRERRRIALARGNRSRSCRRSRAAGNRRRVSRRRGRCCCRSAGVRAA